jgi:curved DNA-binding protein CbpA
MNMAKPTHYVALKISRSATILEIIAAYRAILLASHPDRARGLAPPALNLAHKAVRAANAAWDILSDQAWKQEYDASLPYLDPYDDPWRPANNTPRFGEPSPEREFPRFSGYGFSYGRDDEADGQETDDEADAEAKEECDDSEGAPTAKTAEYRYGSTPTATDTDLSIRGWRLYMLLSSKYRFTELSNPEDGAEVISFELTLERNKSFRANPPDKISSSASKAYQEASAWARGKHSSKSSQRRLQIWLSRPLEPAKNLKKGKGLDMPEDALKWDKKLKANAFCDLDNIRVKQLKYDKVEM